MASSNNSNQLNPKQPFSFVNPSEEREVSEAIASHHWYDIHIAKNEKGRTIICITLGDKKVATSKIAQLEKMISDLATEVHNGFAEMHANFAIVNQRLDNVERRLDNVERRLDEHDSIFKRKNLH